MAFEKLAPYIDSIEKGLADKKSPRAIADELGQPSLWQTIRRYKLAVFDLNKEASEAWKIERAKSHEERLEQGKAAIVDTLEVVNLGKLRARQLLSLNLGDEYKTAEGELKQLSLGSAAIYWQAGQEMICKLSRAELEIAGESPTAGVTVNIAQEIKLDDIIKEYYGSENDTGSSNPQGDNPSESIHSPQADKEASGIPDKP